MGVDIRCAAATTNRLGETPLWCPRTRSVWWVDIEEPKLQQFTPDTGAYRSFGLPGPYAGSLALHAKGGFAVAIGTTLYHFD
ncbi:SMP-30/gluconolactonase/LRE family protein, partial [Rhizobiaceae sp. 2RAB30]